MEAAVEKKSGIKELLTYKKCVTLLCANVVSRFGDSLDSIAYAWMVYVLTGSKLLMGTLFAFNFIPNIVFSFFSGVFADIFPKKRTIMISDFGRGAMVSLTALLFLTGYLKPWHLFVFTIVNSTFETFSNPARGALLPMILPKKLFINAMSFLSASSSFAELLGMALAGFIIGVLGISGAIFIDGATFFISCFLIGTIKLEEDTGKQEAVTIKTYTKNFTQGFDFVKKHKFIKVTIFLGAVCNFSLAPFNVLQPVYVKDILKTGAEGMSIIGIGFTLGMILGGLLMGQIGQKFKKSRFIVTGFIVIGVCYALLGLPGTVEIPFVKPVYLAGLICLIFGFFIPVASAPAQSYSMENTPKEMLGRVSAFSSMLVLCALPLGSFLTGVVSEYVSIPVLFAAMGCLTAVTALVLFTDKEFRSI
ncbi:MAG: MFS transporter [Bacillota bacterium]|nr:MFS transporter [Bacillota bacterium]